MSLLRQQDRRRKRGGVDDGQPKPAGDPRQN